jgi:hypothetical protein
LAGRFYNNSNKTVTLIPNKVTLSRFPEELNVDTSSGKPGKWESGVSSFSHRLIDRKMN